MSNDRFPVVGDVITSKRFQFGHLGYNLKPPIQVGENLPKHIVGFFTPEEERIAEAIKTGKIPPKRKDLDLGVPDPSRGTAEFVVIEGKYQGGGTGMGPHDVYPNGWHIVAKRLDKDGKWDPNGEEIAFYMTGCFIDMIPLEEIKTVRHMTMSFV